MSQATLGDLLRYLRTAQGDHVIEELTDCQLLERFLAGREEAAFTLLVQRHGPMVLAVCRRLLGDSHSAEDSFQATFLVLVRRAASIRKKSSVGSWLYAVALHIASKARAQTIARRQRERQADDAARRRQGGARPRRGRDQGAAAARKDRSLEIGAARQAR